MWQEWDDGWLIQEAEAMTTVWNGRNGAEGVRHTVCGTGTAARDILRAWVKG